MESSLLREIDFIIDNVYIRNRSQAIEHLVRMAAGDNRTAVIMAGGPEERIQIGSEYRPTVPVSGKTVIERAVESLRGFGFRNIFIIARQNVLTRIFNIIKDGSLYGVRLNYIEEKDSKGSADSLQLLKGKLTSEFLVVYGDLLFDRINLEEIWNNHLKQSAIATIMMTTSAKPSEKGTLRVEGNKVLTFQQKPKKSDIYLVFSPIFVASPEIFNYGGGSLETDVFPQIAERRLLNGYLSSEKEVHIHTKDDARKRTRE